MGRSVSVHTCREKCFEDLCPICHEDMFTSSTPIKGLACGHLMHSTCFQVLLTAVLFSLCHTRSCCLNYFMALFRSILACITLARFVANHLGTCRSVTMDFMRRTSIRYLCQFSLETTKKFCSLVAPPPLFSA